MKPQMSDSRKQSLENGKQSPENKYQSFVFGFSFPSSVIDFLFSVILLFNSNFLLYIRRSLFAICYLLLLVACLFAAPPLRWEYLKDKPPNFRPCGTYSAEAVRKAQSKGVLRKAGVPGIISPTTYYILVVRVDFDGHPMSKTASQTMEFFEGMKKYFLENSYGLVTASATITTRVSGGSPGANGSYRLGSIHNYNDESDAELSKLLNDSIGAANPDYDFSKYHHIMIYHAGYGEEETGNSSDLWSLYLATQFTVDGKQFDGFTVVPELSKPGNTPLGVICHEYGHQLGLPDLYKTNVSGGASTCGAWSLMDYPYGSDGSGRPPPLDMWCKDYLMWVDLNSRRVGQKTPEVFLDNIGTPPSAPTTGYIKIPVEVGTANEYFVLEYRRRDKLAYNNFPGDGVLIWHIDDTIARDPQRVANNSINNGPYPSVDLVEADATKDYPPGQPSDAFTGGSFNQPASNAFNGQPSGVVVANFNLFSSSAMFSIDKIRASPYLSLVKAVNYPNPAGKDYFHPRPGVITTLNFQLSRPPQSMNLAIYNLSGERILNVQKDKLTIRMGSESGASSDEKWIYEYDWDGRDESGNPVAPGIYLYRLRADNQVKVGKMVIER